MDPVPFGYHGCYLRIDVSRGSVDRVPLSETVLRQCLCGNGLGAWLLLEEGQACTDPLAADVRWRLMPLWCLPSVRWSVAR